MKIRFWSSLIVLTVLGAVSLQAHSCSVIQDESAGAPPVLQRVVFIGASATSGAKTTTNLADVFSERIVCPRGPVASCSDSKLFLAPRKGAKEMVQKALEYEPTLVVASDFLFWFLYGLYQNDATRLASLNEGLRMLEGFHCPVVVGTIPDMHVAIGKGIPEFFVPGVEAIVRANVQIVDWAREHHAVLLPVADAVVAWNNGLPYCLNGEQCPTVGLLQDDKLHPNKDGLVLLARIIADSLVRAKLVSADSFR